MITTIIVILRVIVHYRSNRRGIIEKKLTYPSRCSLLTHTPRHASDYIHAAELQLQSRQLGSACARVLRS